LLNPDVDEFPLDESHSRESVAPERIGSYGTTTQYARTLNREFNAVVVEHHLKWAPLCVSS
jgi:hypothetical protein